MYYYNGAQRYEQFLQVGQLYQALIYFGLAVYHPSTSVSSIFMVIRQNHVVHYCVIVITAITVECARRSVDVMAAHRWRVCRHLDSQCQQMNLSTQSVLSMHCSLSLMLSKGLCSVRHH